MIAAEKRIGAISTYLQRLDKYSRAKDNALFFRGHSRASFELLPSLYRNQGWVKSEATMLKEVLLRCPNDFPSGSTTFELLVKMQHYGLPTRLLDITSNPMVALYFACASNDEEGEDGEVIVFRYDVTRLKYFDSDTVSVISNISRRKESFAIHTASSVEVFNADDEVKLLLHDIGQEKPHFKPIIQPAHLGEVLCVKPRLDNPRIIRQEGVFLLFGIDGNKSKPAYMDSKVIADRILISQSHKKIILDQLDSLGINKASLFPEIDQVAAHIKEKYEYPVLISDEANKPELRVFQALGDNPMNLSEIAAQIRVSLPTVRQYISKLNDARLVIRVGSGRSVMWQKNPDTLFQERK